MNAHDESDRAEERRAQERRPEFRRPPPAVRRLAAEREGVVVLLLPDWDVGRPRSVRQALSFVAAERESGPLGVGV